MSDPDDIIVWPCGTYCHRSDMYEYQHKSDDYEVIKTTDSRYESFNSLNVEV